MLSRIRSRMTFSNCISLAALFVALGGTSYAVTTGSIGSREIRDASVRSADIRNDTVRSKDIRNGTIRSVDVRDGSLRGADLAPGSLPVGPPGPAGATGSQGPQGPAGQDGSPDTPAQVLAKLKDVDGAGSGLDADTVRGTPGGDLVALASSGATGAVGLRAYSYFMTTTSTTSFRFGQIAIEAAGVAGQFRICGVLQGSVTPMPWVLYLNGARSTGTVTGTGCSAAFDAGAGGEFQVTARRSIIFGVHSGDGPTNENYNLYGFGQL